MLFANSLIAVLLMFEPNAAFAQEKPKTSSGGYGRPAAPPPAPVRPAEPARPAQSSQGYELPRTTTTTSQQGTTTFQPPTGTASPGDQAISRARAAETLRQQQLEQQRRANSPAQPSSVAGGAQGSQAPGSSTAARPAGAGGGTATGAAAGFAAGVAAGSASAAGRGAVDRSRHDDNNVDDDPRERLRRSQEDDERERQRLESRRLAEQRRLDAEIAAQKEQDRLRELAVTVASRGAEAGRCVARNVIQVYGEAENYRINWNKGFYEAVTMVRAASMYRQVEVDENSSAYLKGLSEGQSNGSRYGRQHGEQDGQLLAQQQVVARMNLAFDSRTPVNLTSFEAPSRTLSIDPIRVEERSLDTRISQKEDDIYSEEDLRRIRHDDFALSTQRLRSFGNRSGSSTSVAAIVQRYVNYDDEAYDNWKDNNFGCSTYLPTYNAIRFEDNEIKVAMAESFKRAYRQALESRSGSGRYGAGRSATLFEIISDDNLAAYQRGFAVGHSIQKDIADEKNFIAGMQSSYESAAKQAYYVSFKQKFDDTAAAQKQYFENTAIVSDVKVRLSSSPDGENKTEFLIGGPITVVVERVTNRGLKTEVPVEISLPGTDFRASRNIAIPALRQLTETDAPIKVGTLAAVPTSLAPEKPYEISLSVGRSKPLDPVTIMVDWETQLKALAHAQVQHANSVDKENPCASFSIKDQAYCSYVFKHLQDEFEAVFDFNSGKYELEENGEGKTLLRKMVVLYSKLEPEERENFKLLKAQLVESLGEEPSRGFTNWITFAGNPKAEAWAEAKKLIDTIK